MNTTEVGESTNPSAAPERSSVMRLCNTIDAEVARTSTFVVDNENERNTGGDVSPIPSCVNVTPGAVSVCRLPTWSTSVALSTVQVPCSDQRGSVTATTYVASNGFPLVRWSTLNVARA